MSLGGLDVEVVAATRSHVAPILALRDERAAWLLDRGIRQWLPGEVPTALLDRWVRDEEVLVALDSHAAVVACVAILREDPEVWGPAAGEARYVHLLLSALDRMGEGLGARMLAAAEARVAAAGVALVRLDAVGTNEPLLSWYAERGYERVGVRHFDDERVFDTVLMEKDLSRTRELALSGARVPPAARARAVALGAVGAAWLDALPELVAGLVERWGLAVDEMLEGGVRLSCSRSPRVTVNGWY